MVNPINSKWFFGLGAYGVSGMGVDYRDKDQRLADMHTILSFMRFIPAITYKINDNFSISGAIHIAYGSLDMGAYMCAPTSKGGVNYQKIG